MPRQILFDTSALIPYIYRRTPFGEFIADYVEIILNEAAKGDGNILLFTCPTVWQELLQGATKAEADEISTLLQSLNQIDVDPYQDAEDAAEIFNFAKAKGHTVPTTDSLICLHALSADFELIHSDRHMKTLSEIFDIRSTYFEDKPK